MQCYINDNAIWNDLYMKKIICDIDYWRVALIEKCRVADDRDNGLNTMKEIVKEEIVLWN